MESKVWADVGLYHLPAEIQATVQVLSLIYKMINAPSIAQTVKSLPAMQQSWVQSLGGEDPQEKGMATHSSILAWKIRPLPNTYT